jgi:hypothetical protein
MHQINMEGANTYTIPSSSHVLLMSTLPPCLQPFYTASPWLPAPSLSLHIFGVFWVGAGCWWLLWWCCDAGIIVVYFGHRHVLQAMKHCILRPRRDFFVETVLHCCRAWEDARNGDGRGIDHDWEATGDGMPETMHAIVTSHASVTSCGCRKKTARTPRVGMSS